MDNEKTPLFHISKRDDLPWQKAGLFRLAAILLARRDRKRQEKGGETA